jgi:alkylated DNA repair dioxygenase AlkB
MSKHTHGPWHWQEGTPVITRGWNGKQCTVATVFSNLAWHEDSYCASRESGANARLIAAAPELLDALQDLFGADMEHVLMGDGKDDQIQAIAKARAAIAKATGAA